MKGIPESGNTPNVEVIATPGSATHSIFTWICYHIAVRVQSLHTVCTHSGTHLVVGCPGI